MVLRSGVIEADHNRVLHRRGRCLWAALIFVAAGCVIGHPPLKNAPRIVASPEPGQLSVAMQPSETVGAVQPVYVSIANGTDVPRAVVPSQIFALNQQGQRVAPLPPREAAREAGGAGELKAAL